MKGSGPNGVNCLRNALPRSADHYVEYMRATLPATLKKLLCVSVSSARLHKESGFARNPDAVREQGMSVRVSSEQLWVVSVPLQQAQLPKSHVLLLMQPGCFQESCSLHTQGISVVAALDVSVSAHLGVQSDICPFRVSHWLATNNHAYCGKSSSLQEHRGPSWGPSGEH